MLEKLISYGTMIGMAFAALIYIQTNFVSAADFKQMQIREYEDIVYKLVIKKQELEEENKQLKSWENAELERARMRLQQLRGD